MSFQVQAGARVSFIENSIVAKLPENERDNAKAGATTIVNCYAGIDVDALSVLAYAAERGKFEEFAEKLEKHYEENLSFVHPDARRLAVVPGAVRAERFFIDCYRKMGIQPLHR